VERVLGVIPARLGSQRLPRKPLHPLAGRPLIAWVWARVSTFGVLDGAVVATDAAEIAEACRTAGATVVMTSAAHGTGTERVAEVASRPEYDGYDIIVNVQGDEPFIEEAHVAVAVAQVRQGWAVGTVATPVKTLEAWRDPAVVKLTRRPNGAALYFSRAPIPYSRDGTPGPEALASSAYLRHVGVYAYRREALLRWVALPEAELETIERLEQLRALAAGIDIGVGVVDHADGGIDTPEDAKRADARLRRLTPDLREEA